MIKAKNTLEGKLNVSVVKEYPELEEITVIPTLDGQELKPNKYGYSKITIKAIPATDVTVAPTEQQQNLKGIFKEVNINPIQVEEITTDLDFSSGDAIELTAQEGVYIKKATINKDVSLIPENIKSGVTVCGVAGDVADTSDADATSNDIIAGKTAYVANEKIAGTYIPLDTTDATATAEDIAKDKTAYVNGEKITGSMRVDDNNAKIGAYENSGTSILNNSELTNLVKTIDFTGIDINEHKLSPYTSTNEMFLSYKSLEEVKGLDMSTITIANYMFSSCYKLKTVLLSNTGKITNMAYMFNQCTDLINGTELDTSSVTNMVRMYSDCRNLVNVPLYNTKKVTMMNLAYTNCPNLSEESLNNILLMCANTASNYSQTKTLAGIGLTSNQATICQNLSNYQAFLDARLDNWILEKENEMVIEIIIKWAIPFILGTVVTGIISYIKNKLSKDKKRERAIEEGVQALLRNELVRRYREYEVKGEMSILDKENIEAMFKQYENLGGNGTVKHLMDELLSLPTKVIKE